ncbi:hypothetical protein O0L34_g10399 [Tuta absoluta]|nr:hypothetical protein O0L34_g10399 [Tuta absoluta]
MIARLCVVGLIVLLKTVQSSKENEDLPLKDQVQLLKFIIKDELKDKQKKPALKHGDGDDVELKLNENFEYLDTSKVKITPINERKDVKKDVQFNIQQLLITPELPTLWTRNLSRIPILRDNHDMASLRTMPPLKLFNPISDDNIAKLYAGKDVKEVKRSKKEALVPMKPVMDSEKAVDIFYKHRRLLYTEQKQNQQYNWVHCEEMITPYMKGMKGELKKPNFLYDNDTTVMRLYRLLKTPMPPDVHKPDIISLLYQISNVQIRLFHWSSRAIGPLLDIITQDRPHTYQNIKNGLQSLFKSWHIDLTNTTNLLTQSKVFRPPCIHMRNQDSSTRSSKGVRYEKPTKPGQKTTCKTTTTPCDDDKK